MDMQRDMPRFRYEILFELFYGKLRYQMHYAIPVPLKSTKMLIHTVGVEMLSGQVTKKRGIGIGSKAHRG